MGHHHPKVPASRPVTRRFGCGPVDELSKFGCRTGWVRRSPPDLRERRPKAPPAPARQRLPFPVGSTPSTRPSRTSPEGFLRSGPANVAAPGWVRRSPPDHHERRPKASPAPARHRLPSPVGSFDGYRSRSKQRRMTPPARQVASRLAPVSMARLSAAARRPKASLDCVPPDRFRRSPTIRFLPYAQRRRTRPDHEPVENPRPNVHDFACWLSNIVRRLCSTAFTLGRFNRGPSSRPARVRTVAPVARPPCTQCGRVSSSRLPRLRLLAAKRRPKTSPGSVQTRPLLAGWGHPTCMPGDFAE